MKKYNKRRSISLLSIYKGAIQMSGTLKNQAYMQGKPGGTGATTTNYSNTTQTTVTAVDLAAFTLVKTVDKTEAKVGDVLNFTVTVTNVSGQVQPNWVFTDPIEGGASYVAGSFKLDGVVTTPDISGAYISHQIPSWAVGASHVFTFQCLLTSVLVTVV